MLSLFTKISLFFLIACFSSHVCAQKSNLNQLEHTRALIRQNPDAAFLQIKRLLNEALDEGDDYMAAICYEQIGEVYYNQAAYSQALDNYYKADKLFRKGDHQPELAGTLIKIGETYYYNRQYTVSLEIFLEALAIYEGLDDRKGLANSYGHIGQTYEKTGNYEEATRFQNLALRELEHANDRTGMAKIYENIGSIYEDKLHLDSALHYFRLALELNAGNNDPMAQIEVINNLGDVYRKTGSYNEALQQTHRAARLAEKMNEQYQLASAYRDLSKVFDLMGRYDSAYHYSEAGREIHFGIFSEDNKKQLTILQTLFELEQKDDAITQFKKDRNVYGILTLGAILIIILLVSLGLSIISRQRLKLKNAQQLSEQNNRLYEAREKAMETDLQNKRLKEENLEGELELKSKELTSHTLHLIQKNQLLDALKARLHLMVKDDKRDQRKELKQLINLISLNSNQDKNWEDFRIVFERVHEHFFDGLKKHCDLLTPADFRLAALLKMNLGSADIATMLGISQDSLRISRYRLRKKLNLEAGESLGGFIQRL